MGQDLLVPHLRLQLLEEVLNHHYLEVPQTSATARPDHDETLTIGRHVIFLGGLLSLENVAVTKYMSSTFFEFDQVSLSSIES